MIATHRSILATCSLRLWALFVIATCTGCSGSPEPATPGATTAPAVPPTTATPFKPADDASIDARARATEAKMTDDERFALVISLLGPVPSLGVPRDTRIPESMKNTSAGYTPGIARLGIPALQSSDASMGVTNAGYRTDD